MSAARKRRSDVSISAEHVDALTGEPAPRSAPEAIATGRTIASIRTRSGGRVRLPIDPDAARYMTVRRRSAGPPLTRSSKPPHTGATFRSPDHALRELKGLNEWFFDAGAIGYLDTADLTHEMLDGVETRIGKRYVRATQTPAGRRVLETRNGARQIDAAIRYLLGRARGRRWRNVEWETIEQYVYACAAASLEETSRRGERTTAAAGVWRTPIGAGLLTGDRLVDAAVEQLGERKGRALARWLQSQELFDLVDRARSALTAGRACIDRAAQRTATRRIAVMRRWAQRPELMPDWVCVPEETESGAGLCTAPALREDVRALEQACGVPYNPGRGAARHAELCSSGAERYGSGVAPASCSSIDAPLPGLEPIGTIDDEIPF